MAENFVALLEKRKPEIQSMLAEWITPERFFAMARQVQKNPLLANCTPESLVECVVQAAQAGLEIGGTSGHFYCIPYGKEAQGQPGWRGLAFLKLKAGAIIQLDCDVVFNDDLFEVGRSSDGDIFKHIQNFKGDRSEKAAYASYARVKLPTGEYQFEVQSKDSIQRHRGHSKQPNGLLWTKFWEEGWRKTAYRVLDKRLPEGVNKEAIERYNRAMSVETHATPMDGDDQLPPDDLPTPTTVEVVKETKPSGPALKLTADKPVAAGKATPPAEPVPPATDTIGDGDEAKHVREAWRKGHNGAITGLSDWLSENCNGITDTSDIPVSQLSNVLEMMES